MNIDHNELVEITIDYILTLFDENNPVYDEHLNYVGLTKELKEVEFKKFLQYKTGISFGNHDETYLDLYLEKLQEYILYLLAEEEKDESELENISVEMYLIHDFDDYSIEKISDL